MPPVDSVFITLKPVQIYADDILLLFGCEFHNFFVRVQLTTDYHMLYGFTRPQKQTSVKFQSEYNFSHNSFIKEIFLENRIMQLQSWCFSFKQMHLKMSAEWRPFGSSLNLLIVDLILILIIIQLSDNFKLIWLLCTSISCRCSLNSF